MEFSLSFAAAEVSFASSIASEFFACTARKRKTQDHQINILLNFSSNKL